MHLRCLFSTTILPFANHNSFQFNSSFRKHCNQPKRSLYLNVYYVRFAWCFKYAVTQWYIAISFIEWFVSSCKYMRIRMSTSSTCTGFSIFTNITAIFLLSTYESLTHDWSYDFNSHESKGAFINGNDAWEF